MNSRCMLYAGQLLTLSLYISARSSRWQSLLFLRDVIYTNNSDSFHRIQLRSHALGLSSLL